MEVDKERVFAAARAAAGGDPVGAAKEAEAALAYCDRVNAGQCRMQTHMLLASTLAQVGEYRLAEEHAEAASTLTRQHDDPIVHLTAVNVLAMTSIANGKTDQAAAAIAEGRELARQIDAANPELEEQLGFPTEQMLEGNQALLYWSLDQPTQAVESQKKWIVLAKRKGGAVLAKELARLGEYQAGAGQNEDAEKSFDSALKKATESGDESIISYVTEAISDFRSSRAAGTNP